MEQIGRSADQPAPPPTSVLPPLEPGKESELFPKASVFVREIRVTGSTVFTHEELTKITAPYVNRELTPEDLETLRRALTLHYINTGYTNSGAIIPDQTLTDGVITIHIIEGELTTIELEGNKWFRDSYYENRLALGAGPPLNINALQERILILQQDERIQRLQAELGPGVKPGESSLRLQVEERQPFEVRFTFDNYQSPTVGAEQGLVTGVDKNLTGHGDILSLTYGRSDGTNPNIDVWYMLPFTARDTTITLRYAKKDFTAVEKPLEDLDVESEYDDYEITLKHPFYRSLNQEFAVAIIGEHSKADASLLGEPFSFSPGAQNGEQTVSALRTSIEWTYRTQTQAIAARSRFSLGLNVLGATNNSGSVPDSKFFSWLGQFQWARVLDPWGIQSIFRVDSQLSADPLLTLEQIAVGGRYTVRGYRENQLVRDNGLVTSLEFRIPLIRNKKWADYVELAPFGDYGRAWNTEATTPHPKTIASVGIGLRLANTLMKNSFKLRTQFEIYWGHSLKSVDTPGDDLQDDGIHLQLVVSAF